ncbi:DUF4245 domain-containing protein [Lysinibacter cavernae]|uniref:DUF4245 domain-containing protein n=1 Tax=Lysinibacter cavernae TaxID=1640652 RepID=A0A7X5QYC9_9MICO|nr:DUF4245 domain-containing protein [Lysinibacter cavernae]NIH52258.1 hypothetical protein [Lysinibacter cavernae]
MSTKPPRVVAELGRPETPAETAARKAENSRLYKSRKTINNLVLSLIATLGVVVVIVLAVPRGDYTVDRSVDFVSVAAEAQPSVTQPLVVPELPDGWKANAAELRHSKTDNVTSWYIGWVTPNEQFAALSQGLDSNPSWVANELEKTLASGTETIGGIQWTVYDNRESHEDIGNVAYALATERNGNDYLVYGTADPSELTVLATTVAEQILSSEQSSESPTDSTEG